MKEKVKINFIGFNIECENPSMRTVVIVAMALIFLAIVIILQTSFRLAVYEPNKKHLKKFEEIRKIATFTMFKY